MKFLISLAFCVGLCSLTVEAGAQIIVADFEDGLGAFAALEGEPAGAVTVDSLGDGTIVIEIAGGWQNALLVDIAATGESIDNETLTAVDILDYPILEFDWQSDPEGTEETGFINVWGIFNHDIDGVPEYLLMKSQFVPPTEAASGTQRIDFRDHEEAIDNIEAFIDGAPATYVQLIVVQQSSPDNIASVVYDEFRFVETATLDPCDFDADGQLGVGDIDALAVEIRGGNNPPAFDIDGDGLVDTDDLEQLVTRQDKLNTYIGDSDLSGVFNADDLLNVFSQGEYVDGVAQNSTWGSGDWNADAEFNSDDLLAAFAGGGYDAPPRPAASAVPEPGSCLLLLISLLAIGSRRRSARAND